MPSEKIRWMRSLRGAECELQQDKSNISHSLRTLAARGLIVIRRTPGGKADALDLTAEGRKRASEIV